MTPCSCHSFWGFVTQYLCLLINFFTYTQAHIHTCLSLHHYYYYFGNFLFAMPALLDESFPVSRITIQHISFCHYKKQYLPISIHSFIPCLSYSPSTNSTNFECAPLLTPCQVNRWWWHSNWIKIYDAYPNSMHHISIQDIALAHIWFLNMNSVVGLPVFNISSFIHTYIVHQMADVCFNYFSPKTMAHYLFTFHFIDLHRTMYFSSSRSALLKA